MCGFFTIFLFLWINCIKMSVSFDKNRDKIISAWKEVLDDKSSTDWLVPV